MKLCEGESLLREGELCGAKETKRIRITGPSGVWMLSWLCTGCFGRLRIFKPTWRFEVIEPPDPGTYTRAEFERDRFGTSGN